MRNGTNPWPIPVKNPLSPEERARQQEQSALAAEKARQEAAAWQDLLAKTIRPSFKAGEPDPDFIRHDDSVWYDKVIGERDQAIADQPGTERALDDIARKYGLDRKRMEKGTLVGDSPGGPIIMTPQDAVSANSIFADDLWPAGLYSWQPPALSRNLAGEGIRVSMWEADETAQAAGILTTHSELTTNRAFQNDETDPSKHATAVAGMIIGRGNVDVIKDGVNRGKLLRGIAYQGRVDGHDLNNFGYKINNAVLLGQSFSNHSYGVDGGWIYADSLTGLWVWRYPQFSEDPRLGLYSPANLTGTGSVDLDVFVQSKEVHLPVFPSGNSNNEGQGITSAGFALPHKLPGGSLSYTTRDWRNGDDGYDSVISPGTAKNVLTVGAISDLNAAGAPLFFDYFYGGKGPTDDGRIKPDIVAVGIRNYQMEIAPLFAPHAASTTSYFTDFTDGACFYKHSGIETLGGTSYAAACVTGGLMLAEQRRIQLLPGASRLLASSWRAAVIHTASDFSNPPNLQPGPDYSFGWGLFNVEALVTLLEQDAALSRGSLIKEFSINTGTAKSFYVTLPANTQGDLTMAWSDPAGNPPAFGTAVDPPAPMLVNDLDLVVQDTTSAVSHLPWILDPWMPAAAATRGADHINNVEKVTIDATPQPRRLKVTVTPFNTLQGGTQKVSLILSGVVPEAPVNVAAGFTGNPSNLNEFAITFSSDPGGFFTLQTSPNLTNGTWTNVSSTRAENITTTFQQRETLRNPNASGASAGLPNVLILFIMQLSLALIAFVSLLLPVAQGEAAVVMVYRGSNPNPFSLDPPYIGATDFDINGDGIADFLFANSPSTAAAEGYGSNRILGRYVTVGIGTRVLPVSEGSIIGADTTFPPGQWLYPGENTPDPALSEGSSLTGLNGITSFIGVEFMAANGIHYGWISYMGFRSPDTNTSYPYPGGFINFWAWETEPGKSITVIPEPSVPVLALGLISGFAIAQPPQAVCQFDAVRYRALRTGFLTSAWNERRYLVWSKSKSLLTLRRF